MIGWLRRSRATVAGAEESFDVIEGLFEGDYHGVAPSSDAAEARRYDVSLLRGTLVRGPARTSSAAAAPITQPRLEALYVESEERTPAGETVFYELPVVDAVLSDWEVVARTESEGGSLGRIRGHLRAKVTARDASALAASEKPVEPARLDVVHAAPRPIDSAKGKKVAYRERGVSLSWLLTAMLLFSPVALVAFGHRGLGWLAMLMVVTVVLWREQRWWKHGSALFGMALAGLFLWSALTFLAVVVLGARPGLLSGLATPLLLALGLVTALLVRRFPAIMAASGMLVAATCWGFLAAAEDLSGAGPSMPGAVQSPSSRVAPRYVSLEEVSRDPAALFADCHRRLFLSTDSLFWLDGDVLRPEAEAQLRQVAAVLGAANGAPLVVEGHTAVGMRHERSVEVGTRRAEAVRQWLVGRGLSNAQLAAVGVGDAEPLVVMGDEDAQRANRRLEVGLACPK